MPKLLPPLASLSPGLGKSSSQCPVSASQLTVKIVGSSGLIATVPITSVPSGCDRYNVLEPAVNLPGYWSITSCQFTEVPYLTGMSNVGSLGLSTASSGNKVACPPYTSILYLLIVTTSLASNVDILTSGLTNGCPNPSMYVLSDCEP